MAFPLVFFMVPLVTIVLSDTSFARAAPRDDWLVRVETKLASSSFSVHRHHYPVVSCSHHVDCIINPPVAQWRTLATTDATTRSLSCSTQFSQSWAQREDKPLNVHSGKTCIGGYSVNSDTACLRACLTTRKLRSI